MKRFTISKLILKVIILLTLSVGVAEAQFESNPLSVALDNTQFDVINSSPGWIVNTGTFTVGGSSAISSIIPDGSSATMSVALLDSIGRGGRVSFDWRLADSVSVFDEFIFVITSLSGAVLSTQRLTSVQDWQTVSVDLPTDDSILSWIFIEDGRFESSSFGNLNGRGLVDNLRITQTGSSLPPECRTFSTNLNSALDTNLIGIIGNEFVCQVEDYTFGGSAAQSTDDTIKFGVKTMRADVSGPLDLIFDWKIEAGEEDFLELSIDFERVDAITGTTEWAERRFSVPEGFHRIRWSYRRFSDEPINLNSGFVDHLRIAEFTDIREIETINIVPIVDLLLNE